MNEGALALVREREKRGWNQRQLAAFVGLDEPLISRLLRGKKTPNLRQATAIEAKLGIAASSWMRASRRRKAAA